MEQAILTQHKERAVRTEQYTLWQIVGIWLAAGLPMWVLGWVIYPAMSRGVAAADAGLLRLQLMCVGLIWQFVLSMFIVYHEEGNLRLATIRRRFWLNLPISPASGMVNKRLWWTLIPFILLVAVLELVVSPPLNTLWTALFPIMAEPPGYNMTALFETPDMRAQWVGAWHLVALYVVLSVFNVFLGEELLFRGVLLPRMRGVFGRWDWVVNSVIFAFYHLHQPWLIPGNVVSTLPMAYSGKRFRSNWFPIILHSGQSVFFLVLLVGLVLGLG